MRLHSLCAEDSRVPIMSNTHRTSYTVNIHLPLRHSQLTSLRNRNSEFFHFRDEMERERITLTLTDKVGHARLISALKRETGNERASRRAL
jgi:hypothetical protein